MFVVETTHSRDATLSFEGSKGSLNWVIQLEGADTETTAHDYVVANAPATFTAATGTSYKRQSIAISHREEGNGLLDVEVLYAQTKPVQFSFQTGGGSEKIEFSRGNGGVAGPVHKYDLASDGSTQKDSDSTAPDFHGAINVTKTSIEGANIKTAQFSFKISKSWAKGQTINSYGTFAARTAHDGEANGYRYLSTDGDGADVTTPILYVRASGAWAAATHVSGEMDGQYLRDLERLTATTNLYPVTIIVEGVWMYFDPGELFFEGTDGGKSADDRIELTYAFSVSRSIKSDPENPADPEGRMLGKLYISEKNGWDLIWAYSEEKPDLPTNTITRDVIAAYVEEVYDYQDFSKLRLDE
jgi:hypothetical protein